MANIAGLKTGLDPKVQAFNDRLDELVKVLGGDQDGFFKPETVWPDEDKDPSEHAAKVIADLRAAPVDEDLQSALRDLVGGLGDAEAVRSAFDKVIAAIETAVEEARQLNEQIGVQTRVDAFNALNTANNGVYGQAPFGFIPALGGVLEEAGASVDPEAALAPLAAVAGAFEASSAYSIFANYAIGSLELLTRAFDFDSLDSE